MGKGEVTTLRKKTGYLVTLKQGVLEEVRGADPAPSALFFSGLPTDTNVPWLSWGKFAF